MESHRVEKDPSHKNKQSLFAMFTGCVFKVLQCCRKRTEAAATTEMATAGSSSDYFSAKQIAIDNAIEAALNAATCATNAADAACEKFDNGHHSSSSSEEWVDIEIQNEISRPKSA